MTEKATKEAPQEAPPKLIVGLGPSVGRSGPFPVKVDLPTKNGNREATVFCHPWDQVIMDELEELGVSTNVFEKDEKLVRAQNRVLAVLLIDKEKGWKNLVRYEGDEFEYVIPSDEDEANEEDCRVMLADRAAKFFGTIKGKCFALCSTIKIEKTKNSGGSSGTTSTRQSKAKPKRRRASSKRTSASKAK